MLEIEDFEAVFPSGAHYTKKQVEEIRSFQSHLHGKTFFERLLDLLHINARKAYPPPNMQQLENLHKLITEADIALHYKHSLLFYLLKDISPNYYDQTDVATAFAQNVHLEKRFWTFIEGLWALDHLQFETAVGNLTHPSIIPTFPDEIMEALLDQRNIPMGATYAEYILPMAYYNCAKPPLAHERAKIAFVRYMADRSVTDTFYWIRGRPEHEHKQLLEILVEETLEQHSVTRNINQKYTREERAMELVNLPFDDEEEQWVEAFLTEGKGRNFHAAKDTVIMRKIATGRLSAAADDGHLRGKKHENLNWEVLKDGLRRGLGPRGDEDASFAV
ncbi:nuclear pore complex assembly-domain-containing protein [Lophiotrema nucula]|uniref:Nuclear pore complex assembly-domain-containing protein n=1 Tax=Lophiotrema nucula TaxID=690887 RepID=A0A6A5ZRV1_9PLEO|nr:nuclear pore complex assembly-domain-containing protein [Lophiotrema nucula]